MSNQEKDTKKPPPAPPPPEGGFDFEENESQVIPDEELTWKTWHGSKGNRNWEPPVCVARTSRASRRDQNTKIDASEYEDHPDVLNEKMKLLAKFLKKSKHTTVYTGAGISRGAGIPDYASKAENSVTNAVSKLFEPMDAIPTVGHAIVTNLERKGLVHYYVQQNHDGLPQKAGFPQEKMNEIHGAWFDPSNRVVQFYEYLRRDLCNEMYRVKNHTNLCLCMGTSLSGMTADDVVKATCKRYRKKEKNCIGSVIINLQKTKLDVEDPGCVSLRVWGKIDDALNLLMKHLKMETKIYHVPDHGDVIECPYDSNGVRDKSKRMILDLSTGQKVRVCKPGGIRGDYIWDVIEKDGEGNFQVFLKREGKLPVNYRLGKWWMDVCKNGRMKQIPIVNDKPKFLNKKSNEESGEED